MSCMPKEQSVNWIQDIEVKHLRTKLGNWGGDSNLVMCFLEDFRD